MQSSAPTTSPQRSTSTKYSPRAHTGVQSMSGVCAKRPLREYLHRMGRAGVLGANVFATSVSERPRSY